VVLNLPVVPTEKYEKLAAVIKKIYGSIGTIREGRSLPPRMHKMPQRSARQLLAQSISLEHNILEHEMCMQHYEGHAAW